MVSRLLLWPLRLAVPAVFLAIMVVFIRFPLGSPAGHGVVRLSWRALGARVRVCETFIPSGQKELPPALQGAVQNCSITLLPYRLTAWVDGKTLVEKAVTPGGWRGDRPLFVNEGFPFLPGSYSLRVEFRPMAPPASGGKGKDDAALAQARALALKEARTFELERAIPVQAGQVTLVGLDEEKGELFVRTE